MNFHSRFRDTGHLDSTGHIPYTADYVPFGTFDVSCLIKDVYHSPTGFQGSTATAGGHRWLVSLKPYPHFLQLDLEFVHGPPSPTASFGTYASDLGAVFVDDPGYHDHQKWLQSIQSISLANPESKVVHFVGDFSPLAKKSVYFDGRPFLSIDNTCYRLQVCLQSSPAAAVVCSTTVSSTTPHPSTEKLYLQTCLRSMLFDYRTANVEFRIYEPEGKSASWSYDDYLESATNTSSRGTSHQSSIRNSSVVRDDGHGSIRENSPQQQQQQASEVGESAKPTVPSPAPLTASQQSPHRHNAPNSSSPTIVRAHAVILSQLQYFRNLFSYPFKEGHSGLSSPERIYPVDVHDIRPEVFRILIEYIYTLQVQIPPSLPSFNVANFLTMSVESMARKPTCAGSESATGTDGEKCAKGNAQASVTTLSPSALCSSQTCGCLHPDEGFFGCQPQPDLQGASVEDVEEKEEQDPEKTFELPSPPDIDQFDQPCSTNVKDHSSDKGVIIWDEIYLAADFYGIDGLKAIAFDQILNTVHDRPFQRLMTWGGNHKEVKDVLIRQCALNGQELFADSEKSLLAPFFAHLPENQCDALIELTSLMAKQAQNKKVEEKENAEQRHGGCLYDLPQDEYWQSSGPRFG